MVTPNSKNTNECTHQQREAVILFADLMQSSELANIWALSDYDEFMKEFQKELGEVVKEFIKGKPSYNSPICPSLEADIRGDEICLKLFRAIKNLSENSTEAKAKEQLNNLKEDVKSALQIAIKMKRRWLLCSKNRERIKEGRPIFDIGIGINQGPILYGKHYRLTSKEPGTPVLGEEEILSIIEKDTPEGYAINVAKRIETHSRELRFSQILVSHTVFELVDPEFRVAFRRADVGPFKGISQLIPVYEVIGIGHFDDQAFEPDFGNNDDLKIFENVVKNNPDVVWLLLDLGHYYFDKEMYEKSAEKYQQVINIIPDFAPAHLYLGRCWFRIYRYEEAVCSLERALQLNELSPRTNNFLAVCFRRLAYKYTTDNLEKCNDYYKKALELQARAKRITTHENPAHMWALNGLARTIAEAPEEARSHFSLDNAEKFAKDALALFNDYKKVTKIDKEHLMLDTLGFIYLKRVEEKKATKEHSLDELFKIAEEKFSEAIQSLDRRYAPDKRDGNKNYYEKLSEIHFHLALLYKTDEKYNEAKKEALEAIKIAKGISSNKTDSDKFFENQYWSKHAESMAV